MDYDTFLQGAAARVRATPGGSGYFSTPSNRLDPHLFDADERVLPEVRQWILDTLYGFWREGFHAPESWSTVWIAGSGASYQWAADRSNGDLDVLIGVDWIAFRIANGGYEGLSNAEIADLFNDRFKNGLWPRTDHTNLNGQVYEVTFYVNAEGTDIRAIQPYAAYDLTNDRWTVRPPDLPENPERLYPAEWHKALANERGIAQHIISRYNEYRDQASGMVPGSPGWHSALAMLRVTVDQAAALFDDIHLGRKQAFGPEGQGYADWNNYRWQSHKRFGTVQALNTIRMARDDAKTEFETEQYGFPILGPEQSLIKAALWRLA